jgi:hypothetical protein
MMKKEISLSLSCLSFLLMTACTNEEVPVNVSSAENVPIEVSTSVSSSIIASPGTRAPYDGTPSDNNSFKAYVLVSQTANDYTTLYEDDEHNSYNWVNWKGTGYTKFGSGNYYYPKDGSGIYMVGLYPYGEGKGWANKGTGSNTPAATTTMVGTLDGKTDLMYATQISSNKAAATATDYPTLTFKHLATRLVVSVKAENAEAVVMWGNLKKIELVDADGLANQVTVTFAETDGKPTWIKETSAKTAMSFYAAAKDKGVVSYSDNTFDAAYTLTAGNEATCVAYLLAPPTKTKIYQLMVYTEKSTLGYPVAVQLGEENTAGNSYALNLEFKRLGITPAVVITDWADRGTANVNVE